MTILIALFFPFDKNVFIASLYFSSGNLWVIISSMFTFLSASSLAARSKDVFPLYSVAWQFIPVTFIS